MPSLGSFLLLASFVVCAYSIAASVAGARRRSLRLIESGTGAFYLVSALMTVASGVMVHAFVTNDYCDQVRPALLGLRAAAGLQDCVLLGRARRVDHVLGVPARHLRRRGGVYQPRTSSRADSVRRRGHLDRADVLHLPDGGAQQPVRDVPRRRRRRKGRG